MPSIHPAAKQAMRPRRSPRSELFRCQPVVGQEATSTDSGDWNPVSIASHLAEDDAHMTDVRCIDASGHDGWDFVCTYRNARLGKRMKIALSVTGNGKALVGSGAVPEDSWLPPGSRGSAKSKRRSSEGGAENRARWHDRRSGRLSRLGVPDRCRDPGPAQAGWLPTKDDTRVLARGRWAPPLRRMADPRRLH